MNRHTASTYLPPFKGVKNITAGLGMGNNAQLVKSILKDYKAAVAQTRKLAPKFNKGGHMATAQAVWDFLKYQITYKEDSGLYQYKRLPSALIATGTGDCKSYTLFAAGIMANLGYPVTIRFAGYGTSYPSHVYVVSGPYIIDAVYTAFNAEKKPYTYVKNYKMEIATISGIGCNNCGQDIGKIQLKKSLKKATTAVKQAGKKATTAVKKAVNTTAKKAAKLTVKAAGMAPRTAFLTLVGLNVHSFAARLNRNRAAALDKWAKLGGDKGSLNAKINAGLKRKAILGIEGIGVVGETVAAVLAAAAPIIVAMAALLGKEKKDEVINPTGTDMPPDGKTAAENASDIINAASNLLGKNNAAGGPGTDASYSGGNDYNPQGGGNNTTDAGTAPQPTGSGITTGTMLLIAAGAFLLLKK